MALCGKGIPFRLVRKDNGKSKVIYSDQVIQSIPKETFLTSLS